MTTRYIVLQEIKKYHHYPDEYLTNTLIYNTFDTYQECISKLESMNEIKKENEYFYWRYHYEDEYLSIYEYKIHKYEKIDNEYILKNKEIETYKRFST